jgi:D-alanyl-lipoteichoic acid acyltransferase DltB (MBOAT superfamily)
MLFNSLAFLIFLPLVYILYWCIPAGNRRSRNILLLISSYFFYACWSWHFLFLLLFSTFLDFWSGKKIESSVNMSERKFWFWLSVGANIGFLGIFKYYDFFAESFATSMQAIGIACNPLLLKVVLPVGISFYTFHGLSYVIDIYNRRISAEKDPVDYGLFVSFFPLLVAGPIERATHLLPQLKRSRPFSREQSVSGLRQILWGMFKKVVIADNCAELVDLIYADFSSYDGWVLAVGAVFFSFQIYGDFSGYSDIALGVSRLFGVELLRNFAYPYFSRDIAEFWRRWHISLTGWFRDYLYYPLGGNRRGLNVTIRNTFIVFLVSGFWHGANWTFILWGLLNALLFLPLLLSGKNKLHHDVVASGLRWPRLKELFQMLFTFAMVTIVWIFFRAENIQDAFHYVIRIFRNTFDGDISLNGARIISVRTCLLLIGFMLLMEWKGREYQFALGNFHLVQSRALRWTVYLLIVFLTGLFMQTKEFSFIYFQF